VQLGRIFITLASKAALACAGVTCQKARMEALLSNVGIAIIAFASTDIDDLVLVSAFFADTSLRRRAVVFGQFIGVGILVAGSAIAAWLALAIPPGWAALLGFAPLGIGLVKLWELWRGTEDEADSDGRAEERRLEVRLHSQVLAVAAVTIANGGDNLSVYIPMFANDICALPLYAAVFAAMTALWCLFGYLLVSNRVGAAMVGRWGHRLLPFVLIGIGLHILWGAAAIWGGR
jgi:cadmium resistance protein CadD (predicted permease)